MYTTVQPFKRTTRRGKERKTYRKWKKLHTLVINKTFMVICRIFIKIPYRLFKG